MLIEWTVSWFVSVWRFCFWQLWPLIFCTSPLNQILPRCCLIHPTALHILHTGNRYCIVLPNGSEYIAVCPRIYSRYWGRHGELASVCVSNPFDALDWLRNFFQPKLNTFIRLVSVQLVSGEDIDLGFHHVYRSERSCYQLMLLRAYSTWVVVVLARHWLYWNSMIFCQPW